MTTMTDPKPLPDALAAVVRVQTVATEDSTTKAEEAVADNRGHRAISEDDEAFLQNFPDKRATAAVRKVDYRLMPVLGLIYMFSTLDRANIGNAKIEGLPRDLGITDTQFETCLAIFFLSYVAFEVPSNYLLSRVSRPSQYIGFIVVCWGTIITVAGLTRNFASLLVVRLLLGLFEAGFFPGALLVISRWYLPHETQTRIALLYSASAASGAFSGLLAAGIELMSGWGGLAGWRWIFIIEGLLTVLGGILSFFFLLDSPARSSGWLEPDEIRYLELRQKADPSRGSGGGGGGGGGSSSGSSDDSHDNKRTTRGRMLWSVLTDWQLYLQALTFWGSTVPTTALKFTMPQIIKTMGFTTSASQLLTAPPYLLGGLTAFAAALWADRIRWRMPFVVAPLTLVVTAFAILLARSGEIEGNVPLCYFALILACMGIYPMNPATSSWTLNNLAGPTKRAMGIAYMLSLGNTGGLIGSFIFKKDEAPGYPTGFGSALAISAAALIAALLLEYLYDRINKQRDAIGMSEEDIHGQYTQQQLEDLGDKSPLFRYTL